MISVPNSRVACEPFESISLQKEGNTFKTVKQKTALVSLKVVFGDSDGWCKPGDRIYLNGNVITLSWTNEIFTLGEGVTAEKFILVPREYIQLIVRKDDQ